MKREPLEALSDKARREVYNVPDFLPEHLANGGGQKPVYIAQGAPAQHIPEGKEDPGARQQPQVLYVQDSLPCAPVMKTMQAI